MRITPLLTLLLTLLPGAAYAQSTQVGVRAGWQFYDAGGDRSYPMVQVAVEHSVDRHMRVGVQGSWAHIGDVYRPWIRAGSDEQVWRAVATVGYDTGLPFKGVPLLKYLRPVFTGGIGVVHSAGVQTDFGPYVNDPYFRITDQRTGLSYGGGITLEVAVVKQASITGSFQVWRDVLYGGRLYNFDQVLGVAWRV
jgi:hypothetical protein